MKNIMKSENQLRPASFGNVVDQLFQKNLNRFFDDSFWGLERGTISGSTPVNIRETEKTFELEMAAPGLTKEDMKIECTNDMLTISYSHSDENTEESKGYLRNEFRKQSFSRTFNLDDSIDCSAISARYDAGVLKLSLPKKENAQKQRRSIEVQ